MDTSELREATGQAEAAGTNAEQVFRQQVEELAVDIAASVSPDRIKKAVAAALTHVPGDDVARPLSGEDLAKRMESVFAQHLVTDEFAQRVSQLAGEVAGELLGAHVEQALKEYESSEAFSGRVGDIAAATAGDLVSEKLAGPELVSRVRGTAEEVVAEKLQTAIPEALAGVPDEAAVREAAGSAMNDAIKGDDLALVIREIASRVIAENPPVDPQEIASSAAEGVSGAVEEALAARLDPAIGEKLAAALADFAASDELAAAISTKVEAGVAPALQAASEAVGAEQLEGVTSELREAQSRVQESLGGLSERVDGVASSLDAAREEFERKLAGEIGRALEGQVSGDEFDSRVKALAGEVAAEVVSASVAEKLAGVPDADQVRAASREVAREVLDEGVGQKLAEFPDAEQVRATAREVAAGIVAETVSEKLQDVPDAGQVRATAQEVAEEVVARIVEEKLQDVPDAERMRSTAREIAAGIVAETVSEKLSDLPDEARIRELAREVATECAGPVAEEKVSAALATQLDSEELAERITRVAREVSADLLGARVSKLEDEVEQRVSREDLRSELEPVLAKAGEAVGAAELEARAGQFEAAAAEIKKQASELADALEAVKSGSAENSGKLSEVGEQVKALGESVEAVAAFIEDTGILNQRLSRLDLSLERLTPAEQVDDQIQSLYQEVAAAAEKFQNLPAAEKVKGAAKNALEHALKHLQAVEAEQAEKTSEQRLRQIVREETGGFDRDELNARIDEKIKEVVVEMIRSGDLQDQIKGLVRRSTEQRPVPAAAPAKLDAGEVLKEMVDNDDFKIALDERFRTMLDYLKNDVMPRQVKKILKEQAGG